MYEYNYIIYCIYIRTCITHTEYDVYYIYIYIHIGPILYITEYIIYINIYTSICQYVFYIYIYLMTYLTSTSL